LPEHYKRERKRTRLGQIIDGLTIRANSLEMGSIFSDGSEADASIGRLFRTDPVAIKEPHGN